MHVRMRVILHLKGNLVKFHKHLLHGFTSYVLLAGDNERQMDERWLRR